MVIGVGGIGGDETVVGESAGAYARPPLSDELSSAALVDGLRIVASATLKGEVAQGTLSARDAGAIGEIDLRFNATLRLLPSDSMSDLEPMLGFERGPLKASEGDIDETEDTDSVRSPCPLLRVTSIQSPCRLTGIPPSECAPDGGFAVIKELELSRSGRGGPLGRCCGADVREVAVREFKAAKDAREACAICMKLSSCWGCTSGLGGVV